MKFYCVRHKYLDDGRIKISTFTVEADVKPQPTVGEDFDEFWDYFSTPEAAEEFAKELKNL